MIKPQSIRRFDVFYLASVALSVVGSLVSYKALVEQTEAQTAAAGAQLGAGTVIATIVLSIAISLLLWFLVSRKALAIAKWIIVLLFAIGLLSALGLVPGSAGLLSGAWTSGRIVSALTLLAEAVAVYYLFQPDAKAWFAPHDAEPGEPVEPD